MPTYWDAYNAWKIENGHKGWDEYEFVGWMMIFHPNEAAKSMKYVSDNNILKGAKP